MPQHTITFEKIEKRAHSWGSMISEFYSCFGHYRWEMEVGYNGKLVLEITSDEEKPWSEILTDLNTMAGNNMIAPTFVYEEKRERRSHL